MLEILKTDDGSIKACLEWYLVNARGEFDNKGEWVWINDVYIAPQFRNNGILKTFVKNVIEKCPQAMFGYFHRRTKYPERGIRIYHKSRWLKLIGRG
jgi:GNAT superfamily N-acetyltransferase